MSDEYSDYVIQIMKRDKDFINCILAYSLIQRFARKRMLPTQFRLLMVISYHEYFGFKIAKKWGLSADKGSYYKTIRWLEWKGYVVWEKNRSTYLTLRGQRLIEEAKAFYDSEVERLANRG